MAITLSEPKPMTQQDWRKLTWNELFDEVALRWKGQLNLRDWEISWSMDDLAGDHPDNEAHCIVRTELGHEAEIIIADRIAEYEPDQREKLIVHELVHIILDEMCSFVFQYLPEEHHTYFRRQVEIAVSDLTNVLIDLAREGDAQPTG
jgi:hypothetical protein